MCVISILAPTTKPVCVHGTPNTLKQHIGGIIYVKQPRHHPASSSFIHWFLLLQKVKVKNNISTLKLTKTNKWDCFNKQTTNRAHQFSSHETPEISPSSGPLTQKLVRFECNIHVGILIPSDGFSAGKGWSARRDELLPWVEDFTSEGSGIPTGGFGQRQQWWGCCGENRAECKSKAADWSAVYVTFLTTSSG